MKNKCYNHPNRIALSFCHSCGRYFCEECLVEGIEYYYCKAPECQAGYRKKVAAAKELVSQEKELASQEKETEKEHEPDEMNKKCYNHPEINAIGSCHYCGRSLCSKCLVKRKRKSYYCCRDEKNCLAYQEKELIPQEKESEVLSLTDARRRRMKTLKVIAVIAAVAGVIWWVVTSHKETERQRSIVSDVRPLINECNKLGDVPISILGKCLVWDVSNDSRSGAHSMLPGELKMNSPDTQITVFMVQPERKVLVGHYSISGEPGYRQYIDVCVAYWPQKKAVGMHSVVSKEPRSSREVQHTPEYGDPNEPIAAWIQTLGRAK